MRYPCNDFRCVCRCHCHCENFKCRVSTENLRYVFDIRDHPTAVKCLPIAVETFRWMSGFKWKSGSICQMDSRKAKLIELYNYIRWLGRCCWAAKSVTRSHSAGRGKALPNKILDKFKSFQSLLTDSQEHHGLRSAIPTLRFSYKLVPLRFSPVPKHSCKTSHISRMLTTRCQRP